jgi:hypothetical protein
MSKSDRGSLAVLIGTLCYRGYVIEEEIEKAASKLRVLIGESSSTGDAGPALSKAQQIINVITKHLKAAHRAKDSLLSLVV